MDEFTLTIDIAKFRSTNAKWNELMLNAPWSIGYVSTLIKTKEWQNKEEWEEAYYLSGEERNRLIKEHKSFSPDYFNNIAIPYNKNIYNTIPSSIKSINTQYGRTLEDLRQKAEILYKAVKDNGHNLSLEECFECVRFRIICETWNGIALREKKTLETLKRVFPSLLFIKSDGEIDYKYAVDIQVYQGHHLLCALQIKPPSYLGDTPYIAKAKFANLKKNEDYHQFYGVPVFTVISTNQGEIKNPEILSQIRERLLPNN